jgi:hypothetical protein
MSVVIVGGNHCMQRLYMETCKKYGCTAKVYIKEKGAMKCKIGSPDLLILFTSTVSHGMRECAEIEARRCNAIIERSHSSSLSALQIIMENHCGCREGA